MNTKHNPEALLRTTHELIDILLTGHNPHAIAGLNKTESRALMICSNSPGIEMSVLSHKLNMRKGSVTTLVSGLMKKGLAARRQSETDKRCVHITLTPKGIEAAEKNRHAVAAIMKKNLSALSAAEQKKFYAALGALADITKKLETHKHGKR